MSISAVDSNAQNTLASFIQNHRDVIAEIAKGRILSERDLELYVLFNLPKYVDSTNLRNVDSLRTATIRIAEMVETRIGDYAKWLGAPSDAPKSPTETRFTEVAEEEARIILERFHYIGSHRKNSYHLGLKTPRTKRIVALMSLSSFDLWHVVKGLPAEVQGSEVYVVSRLFAFGWAPRNSISYLMGKAYTWIRESMPNIKMLLTYINPNHGLDGASYKASNWVFFGQERGTRYAYIDGQYITDRELETRFGTANPTALKTQLGERYEVISEGLKPLRLFAYFIDQEIREKYAGGFDHDFQRP